jgi:hypothetical protein
MAIDTAAKRRSVAGFRRRGSASVSPNLDQDQAWRQQVAHLYSGILVGGAVIPPDPEPEPEPFVWAKESAAADAPWSEESPVTNTWIEEDSLDVS